MYAYVLLIYQPDRCTMQSDELAHLSNVYSVITGACIPNFCTRRTRVFDKMLCTTPVIKCPVSV